MKHLFLGTRRLITGISTAATKALMWPKDATGAVDRAHGPEVRMAAWVPATYYDENNGYTYTWDVPHDYGGLIALMGGAAKPAEAKPGPALPRAPGPFQVRVSGPKLPDSTSMAGQFSMGNEPSLAIPYIYNRLGAPWKTQKRVRMLARVLLSPRTLRRHPRRRRRRRHERLRSPLNDGILPSHTRHPHLRHRQPRLQQSNNPLTKWERVRHPRAQYLAR